MTKKKNTFTISTFTERGARSLRRYYEKAGYEFISVEIKPDNVLQVFKDLKDTPALGTASLIKAGKGKKAASPRVSKKKTKK